MKMYRILSVSFVAAINKHNCVEDCRNCVPLWQIRLSVKILGIPLASAGAVLAQLCPMQVLKLIITGLRKGRSSFTVFLFLSILIFVICG